MMDIRPTVLYVAEHESGARYLGKTIRVEDLKAGRYTGSGRGWSELKSQGGETKIISISEVFTSADEIRDLALLLSEELDVVKSPKWLNEKVETGLDGGGQPLEYTDELRAKMSRSAKARSTPATAAHLNTPEAALKKRKPKSNLPPKRECTHCGDTFRPNMHKRHEAACSLNPVNIRHCEVCEKILRNDLRSTTCSRRCGNIKRGRTMKGETNGD